MLAHRTSPTNIGLYLLSVACARQFGWIGVPPNCWPGCRRHAGHAGPAAAPPRPLLQLVRHADLAPLLPMYVSTVDSGNLSGHLLAVAQACLALARKEPAESEAAALHRRWPQRCEALAWAADFSFLYHPRRHLLHIGYRVAEQQLDAGFYDLLASESRLTSLLAIAKGDVPVRHWASLGRPFFAVGARGWPGCARGRARCSNT
jgi:cyclic beta-1,2-glucan synthetase